MAITMLFMLPKFYNVAPPRCRVGAFEIVLDGIGKDISPPFAVLLCVLLGTEDNGL